MVKLTPEQQSAFIKKAPKAFTPCSGAWGRQGCTNVHLPFATKTTVRAALTTAAKNIVARSGASQVKSPHSRKGATARSAHRLMS